MAGPDKKSDIIAGRQIPWAACRFISRLFDHDKAYES